MVQALRVVLALAVLSGCSSFTMEYPTQDAYRASLEERYASGVLPPEAYTNFAR